MSGYVDYALDFFKDVLSKPENEKQYGKFTEDQLYELEQLFLSGLHWAKDEMCMETARNYRRKY